MQFDNQAGTVEVTTPMHVNLNILSPVLNLVKNLDNFAQSRDIR
jgi:hypothetical protein